MFTGYSFNERCFRHSRSSTKMSTSATCSTLYGASQMTAADVTETINRQKPALVRHALRRKWENYAGCTTN